MSQRSLSVNSNVLRMPWNCSCASPNPFPPQQRTHVFQNGNRDRQQITQQQQQQQEIRQTTSSSPSLINSSTDQPINQSPSKHSNHNNHSNHNATTQQHTTMMSIYQLCNPDLDMMNAAINSETNSNSDFSKNGTAHKMTNNSSKNKANNANKENKRTFNAMQSNAPSHTHRDTRSNTTTSKDNTDSSDGTASTTSLEPRPIGSSYVQVVDSVVPQYTFSAANRHHIDEVNTFLYHIFSIDQQQTKKQQHQKMVKQRTDVRDINNNHSHVNHDIDVTSSSQSTADRFLGNNSTAFDATSNGMMADAPPTKQRKLSHPSMMTSSKSVFADFEWQDDRQADHQSQAQTRRQRQMQSNEVEIDMGGCDGNGNDNGNRIQRQACHTANTNTDTSTSTSTNIDAIIDTDIVWEDYPAMTSRSSGSNTQALATATATEATSASTSASTPIKFRKYQANQWEQRYHELVQYQKQHGHCLVDPNDSKTLSHWIKRQRFQYKQKMDGNHSTLTDGRQSKLQALGFVWDTHEAAWEFHFRELIDFQKATGHTNVPTQYAPNPPLGIWVKGQRRQYRLHSIGKKSTLTAVRVERLNAMGFVWAIRASRMTRSSSGSSGSSKSSGSS